MKTKLVLFLAFLFFQIATLQSQGSDSTFKKLDSTVKINSTKISSITKEIKALSDSVKLKPSLPPIPGCANCDPQFMGWLLVCLPILLFLLLSFYFLRWLKRENFKLSDALSSDKPDAEFTAIVTTIVDPKDPTKTQVTETREPNYSKSASRVIAFLTSISAIVIGLSMVTLYMYGYITKSGDLSKIDELWKVIAGLGIGVVPYVSKTISEKASAK